MIEEINININETVSTVINLSVITREIITDIINFSNIYNFKKIKSNGNIITNLLDNAASSPSVNLITLTSNEKIHYMGILLNRIEIYLDSDMRWDDNRIIPIYDDNYLRNLKLNKIVNKQIKHDILNEIKVNNFDF